MKPALWRALALLLLAFTGAAFAHEGGHPPAAPKMRAAAEALIESVAPPQRAKLVLAYGDAKRTDWHYTPRSRPGLSFGDLKEPQRQAVHDLLKSALSEVGHRKVVNIVELEQVLRETQFALSFLRDPEKYSLVIFGKPDAKASWGWRFEGHHLSLSFTLRGDQAVATTPSFFGANPAEVRKGAKKGLRALAAEQDEALKLLASFDESQRRTAIVDERSYGDIVSGAASQASPLEQRGLLAGAMTPAQRAQLQKLIEVYADAFEPGLRAARLARVREGDPATVRFAWAGTPGKGGPHYYRIQGAQFLIEFDASQDDGNHIHTVWRDFSGDFGRDLLREHHSAAH